MRMAFDRFFELADRLVRIPVGFVESRLQLTEPYGGGINGCDFSRRALEGCPQALDVRPLRLRQMQVALS